MSLVGEFKIFEGAIVGSFAYSLVIILELQFDILQEVSFVHHSEQRLNF